MKCPISNTSFQRIARQLYANLEDKVVEFFKENPNPSDDDLHSWAEDEGYDPHDIEELVYEIATKYVQENSDETTSEDDDSEESEEEIEGGLADEEDPEKYDLDQLLKGIEVEFEHTDEPEVALEIAMDHLEEQEDYYDKLEDMESKEGNMKLQGISQEGMKRIANKVKAGQSEVFDLEDYREDLEDLKEYSAAIGEFTTYDACVAALAGDKKALERVVRDMSWF